MQNKSNDLNQGLLISSNNLVDKAVKAMRKTTHEKLLWV